MLLLFRVYPFLFCYGCSLCFFLSVGVPLSLCHRTPRPTRIEKRLCIFKGSELLIEIHIERSLEVSAGSTFYKSLVKLHLSSFYARTITLSVALDPPAVGDGVADGKTALTALPETMTTSVSPLPTAVNTELAAKVSGVVLNVHTKDW